MAITLLASDRKEHQISFAWTIAGTMKCGRILFIFLQRKGVVSHDGIVYFKMLAIVEEKPGDFDDILKFSSSSDAVLRVRELAAYKTTTWPACELLRIAKELEKEWSGRPLTKEKKKGKESE
jgi:hypothetical protein